MNLDQLTVNKNNEVWKRVCRKEYEVYLEWKLEQYMKSLKGFSQTLSKMLNAFTIKTKGRINTIIIIIFLKVLI